MEILLYDGSFEGFLCAVFHAYENRYSSVDIQTAGKVQPGFFGSVHHINTEEDKAKRVLTGLEKRVSVTALKQVHVAFLSELPDIENTIFEFIRYAFKSNRRVECDFSNPSVLQVKDIARKVQREKHRMEAFIRFQLTNDGIYYAICQPDYNVLPLIEEHFKKRYADQRWLIYDAIRKYGLYYDLESVQAIQLSFNEACRQGLNVTEVYEENESVYQELWKHYFKSVNIAARKNTKLHIQHMPKRYWKWLTEK